MLGLNLEDATDWQRNLLAHIHVVDNERCGTMLLFDNEGNALQSIRTPAPVLQLPIRDLRPENRVALRKKLEGFYQSLDAHCDTPDTAVDRVINTATQKIAERPKTFRYRPTPEEQRQILRIFNEMQKYPYALEPVFNADRQISAPAILTAFADRLGTRYLLDSQHTVGFFSPTHNIIGLADVNPRTFASTVAEEVFHAIDYHGVATRPVFSAQECESLSLQADNAMDERDKQRMKAIAGFRQDKAYKDTPHTWDRELFAKLATFIALRRHERSHNDQAMERSAEQQLCDTPAGKAVIKVLDTLEAQYNTLPAEERQKAARFARQVPDALKAQQQRDLSRFMRSVARRPDDMQR
jgi:hypothetical protein